MNNRTDEHETALALVWTVVASLCVLLAIGGVLDFIGVL